VAPVNLRSSIIGLIDRETAHAQTGQPASITMKMNSLVDPAMIQALYRASQAAVEVRLNVRALCCLRPGIPGVSETISVVSVLDRFLEHSRIFRFENAGDPEYYVGSADLMQRNLDRRVEAVVPVEDHRLHRELDEIFSLTFTDNRSAWDMHPDGSWTQRRPAAGEDPRAVQRVVMERTRART
jgi:polyphosphate kinase